MAGASPAPQIDACRVVQGRSPSARAGCGACGLTARTLRGAKPPRHRTYTRSRRRTAARLTGSPRSPFAVVLRNHRVLLIVIRAGRFEPRAESPRGVVDRGHCTRPGCGPRHVQAVRSVCLVLCCRATTGRRSARGQCGQFAQLADRMIRIDRTAPGLHRGFDAVLDDQHGAHAERVRTLYIVFR